MKDPKYPKIQGFRDSMVGLAVVLGRYFLFVSSDPLIRLGVRVIHSRSLPLSPQGPTISELEPLKGP